mgnify:FL=1
MCKDRSEADAEAARVFWLRLKSEESEALFWLLRDLSVRVRRFEMLQAEVAAELFRLRSCVAAVDHRVIVLEGPLPAAIVDGDALDLVDRDWVV